MGLGLDENWLELNLEEDGVVSENGVIGYIVVDLIEIEIDLFVDVLIVLSFCCIVVNYLSDNFFVNYFFRVVVVFFE